MKLKKLIKKLVANRRLMFKLTKAVEDQRLLLVMSEKSPKELADYLKRRNKKEGDGASELGGRQFET